MLNGGCFTCDVKQVSETELPCPQVTAIELILCVVASVCMFEMFFLHFSEVTLQALFISATAKFLGGTKDTLQYTGKILQTIHEMMQ